MVAFVVRTNTSIRGLEILGGFFWPDSVGGFFWPDSVGNQALLLCPVKQVSLKADYSIW